MNIQTRLHKMVEAVMGDRIAIGNTQIRPTAVTHGWRELVQRAQHLPLFVLDPDLLFSMDMTAVGDSVKAMIDADCLRLPYPQMIIESAFTDLPDETFFVIIEDNHVNIIGYVGELAVIYPTRMEFFPHAEEKGSSIEFRFRDAWLEVDLDDDLQMKIDQYLTKVIGRMMGVAYVVTNLQGVAREVIEVPRLNKQRVARGKIKVPSYTYLRIGHVYKATGEKVKYVKGSQTKVFMRRGHVRNQRCGKDLSETKLIYISPVLVNYRDSNQAAPQVKVKW